MRFLCFLSLCVLSVLLCVSYTVAQSVHPDQLTQQGFIAFEQGQNHTAWQLWERAEAGYRQTSKTIGVAGSQINQSLAQQAMGQQVGACYTVTEALALPGLCDQARLNQVDRPKLQAAIQTWKQPHQMIGLKVLGDNLRLLGQTQAAIVVLQQATQGPNPGAAWLSLGQLYQAQQGQMASAKKAFEQAIALSDQSHIQVAAQVGCLITTLDGMTAEQVIVAIGKIEFLKLSPFFQAQTKLQLAQGLLSHAGFAAIAAQQAEIAIALNVKPTQAIGWLRLAQAQCELDQDCRTVAQRASYLGQEAQDWTVVYQAQALIGQAAQRQGRVPDAAQAYRNAHDALQRVRQQLQGMPLSVKFDFTAQVEPIYRAYLDTLFQQPQNLDAILQVNSELQVAELESFLGCKLPDWTPIHQLPQQPHNTAIFVVRGQTQTMVIVAPPQQPRFAYTVDTASLERGIFNLLANVQADHFLTTDPKYIQNYGQALYQTLLAPAKAKLPKQGNLLFVLDPTMQQLPIDFLHDGQDYLLRRHSLSLGLGSQIRMPKQLKPQQLKVLLAGISERAPSFSQTQAALTQTSVELAQVKRYAKGRILLNHAFTVAKFKRVLRHGHYPIIHISSHGQFTSDPATTGIFAWDRTIGMSDLRKLILAQNDQRRSIELLVLSACETAKGDQRSLLGLAGVSAQAGVRSTIASLWLVDETASVVLMEAFYHHLSQGLGKAEALRLAKLELMESEYFSHPFFWGSFVLLGSWL